MPGPGHECFHCKQWIPAGVEHDCWTTTEQALTKDLSEDLRDAWERLRETAVEFGDQRIYASHHSIMFSRKACYFFVRPRRSRLEVVFFLGRPVKSPLVTKVVASSKTKRAHIVHIIHRDQVEAPLTDWLREAYGLEDQRRPARRVCAARARSRR
jgi:hypothetical protein